MQKILKNHIAIPVVLCFSLASQPLLSQDHQDVRNQNKVQIITLSDRNVEKNGWGGEIIKFICHFCGMEVLHWALHRCSGKR